MLKAEITKSVNPLTMEDGKKFPYILRIFVVENGYCIYIGAFSDMQEIAKKLEELRF